MPESNSASVGRPPEPVAILHVADALPVAALVAHGVACAFAGRLAFRHRRIFVSQYVRPKPAIQHFLVRHQNVRAQPKAGLKERAIILAGGVAILNQTL